MASTTIHLKWFNPVQIDWCEGILHTLKPNQPFFVLADPCAITLSIQADLSNSWSADCLLWVWQCSPHSNVKAAVELCRQLWPLWQQHPEAALLAIGGGTTMDLAKIVRFRLPDLTTAPLYWRANELPENHHRHTLWCATTTSGTGSEVTPWATLWDLDIETPVKLSWSIPNGFADRALIDPALTLSCPDHLTRDTALDTLAHALESIWNHKASDMTRPLAIESAKLVLNTLPELLSEPKNLLLRSHLSKASLLAGLAMSQTQTALAHALSYDLTLREKLPHGHACAVWLPMVMEIAGAHSLQVRHDLELIFGCDFFQAVSKFRFWLQALGIQARDLRNTASGQTELLQALGAARGRNFVGSII